MSHYFLDFEDGDFCHSVSGNMAMDSDGNMMMRMGDNLAMDMDSGHMHFISSWDDEEEDENNFGAGNNLWDNDEDE